MELTKDNSKDMSLLGQLSPSQHESHINGINPTLTDVRDNTSTLCIISQSSTRNYTHIHSQPNLFHAQQIFSCSQVTKSITLQMQVHLS